MSNLTLVIPDAVLKRARMRALSEDTSVNAIVRDYLAAYAAEDTAAAAVEAFVALSDEHQSGTGPAGRGWTRDDLYSDRVRA